MENICNLMWYEWNSLPSSAPCEDEISGMLAVLQPMKTAEGFIYSTQRLIVLRKMIRLWGSVVAKDRSLYIDDIRLLSARQSGRINFFVHKRAMERLRDVSVNFDSDEKRFWGWMCGVWGSGGYLYIPKVGYYLMMKLMNDICVSNVISILRQSQLNYGQRVRNGNFEISIRNQQHIVDFLSNIGFTQTVLALEEKSIKREMKSRANRENNCDLANIDKTVEVSAKHLKLIEIIENAGILDKLPAVLRELMEVRRQNPGITLSELGKSLSTPISKSTVEYRWKKINKIATQILKGEDTNVLREG